MKPFLLPPQIRPSIRSSSRERLKSRWTRTNTSDALELGGKNKSEPVIVGDFLRSILQLVALVHAEAAAGHPARAEMPALIKQATSIARPTRSTMLALRSVHVYDVGRKKAIEAERMAQQACRQRPRQTRKTEQPASMTA